MRHLVIKKQTSMFLQKLSAGSSTYFFLVDNNASAPFAYGDHTRSQIIRVVFVHLWSCLTVSVCVVFFITELQLRTYVLMNTNRIHKDFFSYFLFLVASSLHSTWLVDHQYLRLQRVEKLSIASLHIISVSVLHGSPKRLWPRSVAPANVAAPGN